jgi:hypothetical protein
MSAAEVVAACIAAFAVGVAASSARMAPMRRLTQHDLDAASALIRELRITISDLPSIFELPSASITTRPVEDAPTPEAKRTLGASYRPREFDRQWVESVADGTHTY